MLLAALKYWGGVGSEGLGSRNTLLSLFPSSESTFQLLKHHLNNTHLTKEAAAAGIAAGGRQQHSILLGG